MPPRKQQRARSQSQRGRPFNQAAQDPPQWNPRNRRESFPINRHGGRRNHDHGPGPRGIEGGAQPRRERPQPYYRRASRVEASDSDDETPAPVEHDRPRQPRYKSALMRLCEKSKRDQYDHLRYSYKRVQDEMNNLEEVLDALEPSESEMNWRRDTTVSYIPRLPDASHFTDRPNVEFGQDPRELPELNDSAPVFQQCNPCHQQLPQGARNFAAPCPGESHQQPQSQQQPHQLFGAATFGNQTPPEQPQSQQQAHSLFGAARFGNDNHPFQWGPAPPFQPAPVPVQLPTPPPEQPQPQSYFHSNPPRSAFPSPSQPQTPPPTINSPPPQPNHQHIPPSSQASHFFHFLQHQTSSPQQGHPQQFTSPFAALNPQNPCTNTRPQPRSPPPTPGPSTARARPVSQAYVTDDTEDQTPTNMNTGAATYTTAPCATGESGSSSGGGRGSWFANIIHNPEDDVMGTFLEEIACEASEGGGFGKAKGKGKEKERMSM